MIKWIFILLFLPLLFLNNTKLNSNTYYNVYTWGGNFNGQLGDGTNNNSNIPIKIGTKYDWIQVSSGIEHCVAIDKNTELWVWGRNTDRQLGVGTNNNSNIPKKINISVWKKVLAEEYFTVDLKNDGTLWSTGYNANGQLGLGNNNNNNTLQLIGIDND